MNKLSRAYPGPAHFAPRCLILCALSANAGLLADEASRRPTPLTVAGNRLTVPAGPIVVAGKEYQVRVEKEFEIDDADIVAVPQERLKLSPKKPEGFFIGTRLMGPNAGVIGAFKSFDEESLVIRSEIGGRVLVKNKDYRVSAPFALVGIGLDPSVSTNDFVYASYRYRLQRLDSVALTPEGEPRLFRGKPHVITPEVPELPTGFVRLANLYRPFGARGLQDGHVFPLHEPASKAPCVTRSGQIPKTLAKLRAGGKVKIVTWGDSITVGADVEVEAAWAYAIRRALSAKFPAAALSFSNISLGGSRSAQWLGNGVYPGLPDRSRENCRFQRVLDEKPDLVMMEFLNDTSLPVEALPEIYGRIKSNLDGIGAEWLIITPVS